MGKRYGQGAGFRFRSRKTVTQPKGSVVSKAPRLMIMVGEQPGRGSEGHGDNEDGALSGRSGRKLAKLLGLDMKRYLAFVQRFNLFEERETFGNGEDVPWDDKAAKVQAEFLFWQFAEEGQSPPPIVLLGRRVMDAFGAETSDWLQPIVMFPVGEAEDARIACCPTEAWLTVVKQNLVVPEFLEQNPKGYGAISIPHPSGLNRYYNDLENDMIVSKVLRHLLRR